MLVSSFMHAMENSNANVISTLLLRGQDPFVLYPKKYKLKRYEFSTRFAISEFFKDKNVVFAPCADNITTKAGALYVVMAYISNPQTDFDKMVALKNKVR